MNIADDLDCIRVDCCAACGSKNYEKKLDLAGFEIMDCSECGLIFSTPLPSDAFLSDYYQGFMYSDGFSSANLLKKDLDNLVEHRCREIESLDFDCTKGKKFLDFGGGNGAVFIAAAKLGFDSYYFDLDEGAIRNVKRFSNASDDSFLTNLERSNLSFDIIFCDNVIEHVQDPIGLIKHLYGYLNVGGLLVFKTPAAKNTEMYFCPLVSLAYVKRALKQNTLTQTLQLYFSPYWHCEPPRHLYSFTADSLQLAAINAGVSPSDIALRSYRLGYWNNTSLQRLWKMLKGAKLTKAWLIPLLLLAVVPEMLLKSIQFALTELNLLSPSGLVLHLKK